MALFPMQAGQRITAAAINHMYGITDTSVTTPGAPTSFTDLSTVYTIPASDAAVGCSYRLTASGYGTQGSTAQTVSVAVALAGSTVGITPTSGSGFAAVSTAFRWTAIATLTPQTVGSTATWTASIEFVLTQNTAGSNSEPLAGGSPTSTVTQDSTVANTFSIQMKWGAATGSPTITCSKTTFERLG